LRTLRQLPPGKPGRGELVAFGDPYFNRDQQAEAEAADTKVQVADAGGNVTRGGPLKRRNSPKLDGVDSAELALLPRLPDTADELKSIAAALQADPSKVLFLGKNATEGAVKTMNLSGFRIIAFATHGLVPGELNGLTQPALALSSPVVTGEAGDGLLTMEEILGLKLDADWVILSACNTGAGAGAGAEAASGLGRAFFYAGTRALLVTNWSVHSQSARQLVTDLFKRQADDPKIGRSEALRQAMIALVDGPGYLNGEGKTEFVMRIRCSGRRTRSSAMAACADGWNWKDERGSDAEDVARVRCGRASGLGSGAGDAIDHGRGSQAAAPQGGDRRRPARHPARSEGGGGLAERCRQLATALSVEVRVVRRGQDRS